MKYRAFCGVGILAVFAGACVVACSSNSSDDKAAGGTSAGGANTGGSGGTTSGGKGGSGNAGADTGGDAGNGNGGDTGAGAEGGEAGTANGAAGGGNTGGTDATGGSGGSGGSGTCTADTQTDAKNCGHCGKVCESNECDSGECTPVVVLYPVAGETVDSTIGNNMMTTNLTAGNVYEWELVDNGTQYYRTLRASSTPVTPAAAGAVVAQVARHNPAPQIGAVTFDATNIYQCSTDGVTRTLLSATNATPTKIVAAPTVADGFACNAIAVTATTIFVVDDDVSTGKDSIYSIPVASANGTNKPTLVPNIGERDRNITNLTVIGTNLFWFDRDVAGDSQAQLMTAPVTGGVPKVIDHSLGSSGGLGFGTDGVYIYYTANIGNVGEVRRAPLATLKPDATAVASNIDTFKGLVVNGGYLYFMEGQSREVFRAKSDGSTGAEGLGVAFVQTADNVQHEGFNMTGVDSKFVYFMLNDGLIARLPSTP